MTHQHANYKEIRRDFRKNRRNTVETPITWAMTAVVTLLLFMASCTLSHANEPINVDKLANAIYTAEGGAKTKHPYGILAKYKTTTPRQACINTIKSALKRWDGKGDFIVFLGKTYCPTTGNKLTFLEKKYNIHWVKNVTYFYNKGNANGKTDT